MISSVISRAKKTDQTLAFAATYNTKPTDYNYCATFSASNTSTSSLSSKSNSAASSSFATA